MADISVIKMPDNQSYNIKDATARTNIENLIAIQDEQPSNAATKIWIASTAPNGVQVPTVAEMNTAIGTAIGNVHQFGLSIQQSLPTQDIDTHTIYLIPKTGDTNDVYDEYVYIDNAWEMIGNTQIDLSNYVQKTDWAERSTGGIIKTGDGTQGLVMLPSHVLSTFPAASTLIKTAEAAFRPITPNKQHESVFYGLAKAAGDTTQSQSDNAVGTYTNGAKTAIQTMLGVAAAGDIPDISGKADKLNGTFTNSISLDRKENTTIGEDSVAFGYHNAATAPYTVAVGRDTLANGTSAFAGGEGTIAAGGEEFAIGCNNALPAQEWQPDTAYAQNDYVVYNNKLYYCATPHTSAATFEQDSGWYHAKKHLFTVGNGNTSSSRSNAYVVDLWGNGRYKGNIYVGCNADSTGGTMVPYDVQVNGTSVLNNGVANVPISGSYGLITAANDNEIKIKCAGLARTKAGTNAYEPIVASHQHEAAFYGLAKAAGADMASSNNSVGTYTDAAKGAIQNMLGITSLFASEESATATAAHAANSLFMMNGKLNRTTSAIAIGDAVEVGTNCEVTSVSEAFPHDVQMNGTSIVSNGIANITLADTNNFGVVKVNINGAYGIALLQIMDNATLINTGELALAKATNSQVKAGTEQYKPIVPATQERAVFFGLSKLAGVDLASETVTVGTYPETSKTAIRSLIGAGTPLDVQVNGSSIVSSGVADIPIGGPSTFGLVKGGSYGVTIVPSGENKGTLFILPASANSIKQATDQTSPIVPYYQHEAVFYGLSKLAGIDLANETVTVGTYPETSKTAIQTMLGTQAAIEVIRL